jgi:hypothetical protein
MDFFLFFCILMITDHGPRLLTSINMFLKKKKGCIYDNCVCVCVRARVCGGVHALNANKVSYILQA